MRDETMLQAEGAETRCAVCGGRASRPRAGLCTACFLAAPARPTDGREACAVCGLRDPGRLALTRLGEDRAWLCQDHAWVARCAWPPPATVGDIVWLLTRGRGQPPAHRCRPS